MVTRWVNSVFLSLLIANEGLHCWLFLSDFANPFWWRVVVLLRPPSVGRHFLWLVAMLLSGLSLSFASGLSSPGLSCCFTMCRRCADWLCVHSLLGFRVSWPSCRSIALQLARLFQTHVGSLLPYGSHPSRWGHPCGVEAGLSSIGTKVRMFFPFWGCVLMLSMPLGFWSPYGSVWWLVPAYARPTVFIGATHFLLLDELRASVCGSSLRPVASGWLPGGPSCGRESLVVLSSLQRSSL